MTTKQSVIRAIEIAVQPANRLAAILGTLIGSIPAVGTYSLAHHAIDWSAPLAAPIVLSMWAGLACFSAVKVNKWAGSAFSSPILGACWTLGVEGLLTFAPANLHWLSCVCLAYLVVINAISGACGLVADREAERLEERSAKRATRKPRERGLTRSGNTSRKSTLRAVG